MKYVMIVSIAFAMAVIHELQNCSVAQAQECCEGGKSAKQKAAESAYTAAAAEYEIAKVKYSTYGACLSIEKGYYDGTVKDYNLDKDTNHKLTMVDLNQTGNYLKDCKDKYWDDSLDLTSKVLAELMGGGVTGAEYNMGLAKAALDTGLWDDCIYYSNKGLGICSSVIGGSAYGIDQVDLESINRIKASNILAGYGY